MWFNLQKQKGIIMCIFMSFREWQTSQKNIAAQKSLRIWGFQQKNGLVKKG